MSRLRCELDLIAFVMKVSTLKLVLSGGSATWIIFSCFFPSLAHTGAANCVRNLLISVSFKFLFFLME